MFKKNIIEIMVIVSYLLFNVFLIEVLNKMLNLDLDCFKIGIFIGYTLIFLRNIFLGESSFKEYGIKIVKNEENQIPFLLTILSLSILIFIFQFLPF